MRDILEKSPIKILKGIGISGMLTLILLFIYAALLTYTRIEEGTIVPVIILITAVSILARRLNCSPCNQQKWNNKWGNNRIFVHVYNLYIVKSNRWKLYIEYVCNNNDACWNNSRCDWTG
ncbi:MAG: TIGR04086 family membrane protein [Clostridia bacterium]|nr:TIGR04086 family membrane protein [Clostridia bacterium]